MDREAASAASLPNRVRSSAYVFVLALVSTLLIADRAESGKKPRVIMVDMQCGGRARPALPEYPLRLVEPLRECAANSRAPAPSAAMILEVAFAFGPDGKGTESRASGSENTPEDIVACAKRRARRIVIDPPDNGRAFATQTYALLPANRAQASGASPRSAPAIEVPAPRVYDIATYGREMPIVVRLDALGTEPIARLARDLRSRVEACTESVSEYTGAVALGLLANPNGDAYDVFIETAPPEPRLAECLSTSLKGSRLPSHEGELAWKVALSFTVDEQGVSLVR